MVLSLLGGLVLLVAGGDALVRGAAALARRAGLSPLLIGLTLVGFGTSMPELVTSVEAALLGSPGIAVGNVVGSNIANILLILGLAAVLTPIACEPAAFRRDATVVVIAAIACAIACAYGTLTRVTGIVFLLALAAYVAGTYASERRRLGAAVSPPAATTEQPRTLLDNVAVCVLLAVGGIALTILGARLLVDGAVALAAEVGVSDTIIGLTVVAVGTSLPELVTSVIAGLRRQGDIALGNVLGSNVFNVLGILGATALVEPLVIPPEIVQRDLWAMLAATALLVVVALSFRRLGRRTGALFLAAYAGYLGMQVA
ncbi:MAG: calcium/sodium antiporter [Alphaproteobacteria bacterium]